MNRLKGFIQLIIIIVVMPVFMEAQNYYNIQLNELEMSTTKQLCFEVQLASGQASDFILAGQNYRLYYDASLLKYNAAKSKTLLPSTLYTQPMVKDNLYNIDASGAGVLPFEKHLAFLNVGLDLSNVSTGGIILPASGAWKSTLQLCFDLKQDIDAQALANSKSIFWARADLTDSYATAYVEVAEWVNPDVTQPAIAREYYDMDLSTVLPTLSTEKAPVVFPNPTRGKVWIDYQSDTSIELEIWSVNGQLIQQRNQIDAKNNVISFSLANQPSGLYQIKLKDGQKVFVEQVEMIH